LHRARASMLRPRASVLLRSVKPGTRRGRPSRRSSMYHRAVARVSPLLRSR